MAQASLAFAPKIVLNGFSKNLPISDEAPLTIIREDIIIKGKTAGITVPRQREIPLFTLVAKADEPHMDMPITADQKIGVIRTDLSRAYFLCILALPPA